MSEARPSYRHRVRCHEVDSQGILYNSRYWEIADAAMAEYFRDLGWSYPQLIACGMDPSLIACSARFLRPAALDDELDVVVATTHLGTTSFALDFMLCCADTEHPVAELAISYVNFDPASHHKRTIPEPIRDRLRQSLARDERKANR